MDNRSTILLNKIISKLSFGLCKNIEVYFEKVRELIEEGANINTNHNYNKYTILMIASAYQCPEFVNYLIMRNANLNIQSYDGKSALMYACEYAKNINGLSCINLLIDKNADVKIKDSQGFNALMSLVKNTNVSKSWHDTIVRLINLSDTTCKNYRNETAYSLYQLINSRKFILNNDNIHQLQNSTVNV